MFHVSRHMDKEKIIAALYSANNVFVTPDNPIRGGAGLYQAIYLDHRNLFSFVKERELILSTLEEKLAAEQNFDVLAGKETGGIAPAAIISHNLEKPMGYIRKNPKGSGRRRQIEGEFDKGSKIVIVDDTVVTGGNIRRSTEVLNKAGGEVVGAAAISMVNEDLYKKQFDKYNLHFTYLVTMGEVVDWGLKNNKLDKTHIDEIKEYLDDPLGWGLRNGFDYENGNENGN